MFYVDTVEDTKLPFDGCVDENSSKPKTSNYNQSKKTIKYHFVVKVQNRENNHAIRYYIFRIRFCVHICT